MVLTKFISHFSTEPLFFHRFYKFQHVEGIVIGYIIENIFLETDLHLKLGTGIKRMGKRFMWEGTYKKAFFTCQLDASTMNGKTGFDILRGYVGHGARDKSKHN